MRPEGSTSGTILRAQTAADGTDVATLLPRGSEGRGTSGIDAARAAIEVDQSSVRDERDGLEASSKRMDAAAAGMVGATFQRARGKLPHGAEVVSASDDRVEIVRSNHEGNLLWREVAERDGNHLRFERTEWKDGEARRRTLETGGDEGALERREAWKEPPSRDPSSPTTDELKERWQCDPGVRIEVRSLARDGDDLVARETSFGPKDRAETERTLRSQGGADGIHDQLQDDFDDDVTTDVVETKNLTQQRGEDEQSSSRTTWAQGNVRVTSMEQEGDGAPPKQWMLEKQDGDRYQAQTFAENAPEFTTVVDRTADGDRVRESVRSNGLDEDGNAVESKSSSDTLFDEHGLIASKRVDSTDERGVRTLQEYRRESERRQRGLEVDEWLGTYRREPGHPPVEYTSDRDVRSLESAAGRQLLSSKETVSGPGGTATSMVDGRGPRLTVNAKAVPLQEDSDQLGDLSDDELDMAAQVSATTTHDLNQAAAAGGRGLNLIGIGRGVPDQASDLSLSPLHQERLNAQLSAFNDKLVSRFGSERLDASFRAQTAGSGALRGVAGLAGLASSASSLISDIHGFNASKAPAVALDAGSATVQGSYGVSAVKELQALKSGSSVEEASAAAGKIGSFARFGGLGVGVAAGGLETFEGVREGDAVKASQGGITMLGAVGYLRSDRRDRRPAGDGGGCGDRSSGVWGELGGGEDLRRR